jgi:hypothetical protein
VPASITNVDTPSVVGSGRDGDDRRDRRAAVRDERLGPAQHPSVPVGAGARACRTRIAPAARLGEPERADRGPGDEVRQPALLLVLRPELEDRVGAETDAGGEGDAERLVHAADLLDRDAQRREVGATTAPLLREHEAEEPELTHLQHGVHGEGVFLVPTRDVGRKLLLCEVADGPAELLVLG